MTVGPCAFFGFESSATTREVRPRIAGSRTLIMYETWKMVCRLIPVSVTIDSVCKRWKAIPVPNMKYFLGADSFCDADRSTVGDPRDIAMVMQYHRDGHACLARSLAAWLVGWLAGWLLAGWMAGRLYGWINGWMDSMDGLVGAVARGKP